jgi:hypothetical protein
MKLIYSLYIGNNKERNGSFCGYRSSDDLLDSLLLSSTVSSRHFTACEIYCDTAAKQLIEADGRHFPFTDMIVCFDELDNWLDNHNWAYPKVMAYGMQDEPFVHLDFDAIISDGLPPGLADKKIIFQQKEKFDLHNFGFYNSVYNDAQRAGILPPEISYNPGYAMNMGIFGCPDPECIPLVKTYAGCVKKYVDVQQQKMNVLLYKNEQPMLFEQLFIVNFLQEAGLKDGVDFDTFIDDNFKNKFLPQYRFAHFLRAFKKSDTVVNAIKKELFLMGLHKKSAS